MSELDALERRIDELEGVADSLGDVPDGRLVETLEEAVGLLEEINAGIEARLDGRGPGGGRDGRSPGRGGFRSLRRGPGRARAQGAFGR